MVVGCISRYFSHFLVFLRAEVVCESLDIFLIAGWELGQQGHDSVRIFFDGAESVVQFCSQFNNFLADSFITHNLVHLLKGQFIILIGLPLFDSKFILVFSINFLFLLQVGNTMINPRQTFRFGLCIDNIFQFLHCSMIKQLLVNILQ